MVVKVSLDLNLTFKCEWCFFQVTTVPLVPPIAILLAKHPLVDQYDLSSMTTLISSAAPLSLEIMETVMAKFKCDILQGTLFFASLLGALNLLPNR